MKSLTTAAALCLALAVTTLLPSQALAQARTRRSSAPAQRRRGGQSAQRPDQTQLNSARIKLADRVKTLSQFLYLYGRLSKDLELTGAQTGANDAVAKSRSSLVASVGNVRQGLDDLVAQFRATPGLEQSSAALSSAAQRAAAAESQASAGQFNQAGLTLVEVVRQLTDVLLEM